MKPSPRIFGFGVAVFLVEHFIVRRATGRALPPPSLTPADSRRERRAAQAAPAQRRLSRGQRRRATMTQISASGDQASWR